MKMKKISKILAVKILVVENFKYLNTLDKIQMRHREEGINQNLKLRLRNLLVKNAKKEKIGKQLRSMRIHCQKKRIQGMEKSKDLKR